MRVIALLATLAVAASFWGNKPMAETKDIRAVVDAALAKGATAEASAEAITAGAAAMPKSKKMERFMRQRLGSIGNNIVH